MLEEAKEMCDYLIVGLQKDPTLDRPDKKNKPVQDMTERRIQLNALKCVDQVVEYNTEGELYELLRIMNPDIRFLEKKWKSKNFTGSDLKDIKLVFFERKHDWSTTDLRKRVYNNEVKSQDKE